MLYFSIFVNQLHLYDIARPRDNHASKNEHFVPGYCDALHTLPILYPSKSPTNHVLSLFLGVNEVRRDNLLPHTTKSLFYLIYHTHSCDVVRWDWIQWSYLDS